MDSLGPFEAMMSSRPAADVIVAVAVANDVPPSSDAVKVVSL
jgi:hypothetical protein